VDERALEQSLGPRELQREDGQPDRDDDEGGPGKDQHGQACGEDDEAGDDERGPVDAAPLGVLVAALAQAPHHGRLLASLLGHAPELTT
jgi:hypothetical protein